MDKGVLGMNCSVNDGKGQTCNAKAQYLYSGLSLCKEHFGYAVTFVEELDASFAGVTPSGLRLSIGFINELNKRIRHAYVMGD